MRSLFEITKWLDKPVGVTRADYRQGHEECVLWHKSDGVFDSLREREVLFVYPETRAPYGASCLTYEWRDGRSLFVVAIPLDLVRKTSLSEMESWIVSLFHLGSRRASCVVAGASEVELSLDARDESHAVSQAVDVHYDALWIAASRETIAHLPPEYEIATEIAHLTVVRNRRGISILYPTFSRQ